MKPTKKEIAEAKKAAEKSSKPVKQNHIDELWDVIDEIQKNLETLNDRVDRVLHRLGLQ